MFFFPCYFVRVLCAAIGVADRALHVEGHGRALDVSPDDHGGREDHRGGADFGAAPCRRPAPSNGGTVFSSTAPLLPITYNIILVRINSFVHTAPLCPYI